MRRPERLKQCLCNGFFVSKVDKKSKGFEKFSEKWTKIPCIDLFFIIFQNGLQMLKSEVHSLMKNRSKTLKTTYQFFQFRRTVLHQRVNNRSKTLKTTYQFFQFRSELSFLDAWIQEQIDDIKTDGMCSSKRYLNSREIQYLVLRPLTFEVETLYLTEK